MVVVHGELFVDLRSYKEDEVGREQDLISRTDVRHCANYQSSWIKVGRTVAGTSTLYFTHHIIACGHVCDETELTLPRTKRSHHDRIV